jgi:SAM-dependent methyltransferase
MLVISDISDISTLLANHPDIEPHDHYYWGYQYHLARNTLVAQLVADGGFAPGFAVAEIGCAEGGVLAAFVQAGASRALGTDIEQHRLDAGAVIASALAGELAVPIEFTSHDVLSDEPHLDWLHSFDLVILRDVLEHLNDPALALKNCQKLLKPSGCVFVEFPPYTSPFGGHQHLLRNVWGKIPYMHLLPDALFQPMTRSGWHPADIEEVRRLRNVRLTPKKFFQASSEAGYTLLKERYYLLRPVFKIKFGLPTIPLTPLKWLPLVRSVLSLEANYLLRSLV